MIFGDHDVDIVRIHIHADYISHRRRVYRAGDDLVPARLDRDLIVHALEDDRDDLAFDDPLLRRCDLDVLRPDDRGNVRSLVHVVNAGKFASAEAGFHFPGHDPVEDIALPDEVGDKGVLRLVVNILRRADLLCLALGHDNDAVGHRQRFFLVMRDVNERNAERVVHLLELELHFLAHLEIQRAERLVEKEDRRLIDKSSRDRDSLLLTAGERRDSAALEAFQIDQVEDLLDLSLDLRLLHLLLTKTEGDILINIHMRKERVPLEYCVDRPLVGRKGCDIPPLKKDLAVRRKIEARDHAERRRLAAAGRA